jgi:hypothetical protein
MRKWRYELAAPGLGLAGLATVLLLGAAPAFADVEVNARISKTLDMTVTEHITVTKNVFLDAEVEITASKFAESDATANQGNDNVHACENCAERTDTLSGAGNNNHGVTTINQAGGNLNNQGSAVSAAIDVGTGPPGPNPGPADPTIGFAESSAAANQHNGGAPVEGAGGFNSSVETVNVVFRDALITGSIMSNTGIIYVNQSVGTSTTRPTNCPWPSARSRVAWLCPRLTSARPTPTCSPRKAETSAALRLRAATAPASSRRRRYRARSSATPASSASTRRPATLPTRRTSSRSPRSRRKRRQP